MAQVTFRKLLVSLKWHLIMIMGALFLLIGLVALTIACQGPAGPAGTSAGTLSGKVTNSLTGNPLPGVAITTDPAVKGVTITSDTNGAFSAQLPIGVYSVNFARANFTPTKVTVDLVSGQTVTQNIALNPVKPVAVSAGAAQTAAPAATVTLKATAEPLDGSSVTSYAWTQTAGAAAAIDNPKSDTIKVTLGSPAAYKDQLIKALKTEDRFQVQAINPHVLGVGETATFKVTVTTSTGTYTGTVDVIASLPYEVTTGLADVPRGVPVLLHGKTQNSYSWTLASPSGSKATVDGSSSQNPVFTPDVDGKYTLSEGQSGAAINVYAGAWAGAITGQDANGRPLAAGCTTCHNGNVAPDNFTSWKASGHAEIFTQNLNTGTHYGEDCFSCHTVGYDKKVSNNGFDDAPDFGAFLSAGMLNSPNSKNWSNMLQKFPKAASMANIQCENCHGPNNTSLHIDKVIDPERVSISADVCGSCHGEPLRHGRFQQWEESGHANFDLALEVGTVENEGASAAHCGRCHSGQGFLTWIQQGDLTKRIQGAKGDATVDELKALGLTVDKVQPQTCATCHDPHNPGTTSGEPNNTTVRIQGDTPLLPGGYQAKEVGRGAICITCHNTRNGLHNDANPPTSYSAPHTSAQGDVLMGENAYFISPSQRSPHSLLTDTCATCHMEKTPPPPEFSYEGSGTNHSFKASLTICSDCHSSDLNPKALQTGVEAKVSRLDTAMGTYLLNKLTPNITTIVLKDYTPHTVGAKSYDIKSDGAVIDKTNIASAEPTEPHGQQGFLFTFKKPVQFTYSPPGEAPHSVNLTQAQVQLGDITTDGKAPLVPLNDPLVKAGWNYYLIHADSSGGIHNPSFVNQALDKAIQTLS